MTVAPEEVKVCAYHKAVIADHSIMVEGGGCLDVCYICFERMMGVKKLICRHCKVEIVSRTDVRAILGRSHGKHCPRRNK